MNLSFTNFPPPDKYTPVLRQYLEQRAKTGDAILLFRLGDFYECFFADAEVLAKELEITLTARADSAHPGGKVPMAGIPFKTADSYIAKLLKAGFKVAICEQVGDADGKGPMKRELIRILTPGTLLESEYLEGEKANYLTAIFPCSSGKGLWGLAYADISTAQLKVTELQENQLVLELNRIKPSELLAPSVKTKDPEGIYLERILLPKGLIQSDFSLSPRPINLFDLDVCKRKIKDKFGEHSLEGFGCAHYQSGLQAIGAILDYLEFTCPDSLYAIDSIQVYETSHFLRLDEQSIKNLELFSTIRQGQKKGSLIGLLETGLTSKMGMRLMREWLSKPLLNSQSIKERQSVVKLLTQTPHLLNSLKDLLSQVADLERLNIKLKTNRLNPREMGQLKNSLSVLPGIKALLKELNTDESLLGWEDNPMELNFSEQLILKARELDSALLDELPISNCEGGIFRTGYSHKLDEIRRTVEQNENWLAEYEAQERDRSGIKSLKVCFNKATGFYIELTKANRGAAPANYKIKQNLTNVDRYITQELKEHESKYLLAESGLKSLEQKLYVFLRDSLTPYCEEIKGLAQKLSALDCLAAFASLSLKYHYVCPEIDDSLNLKIVNGRHPVIERTLPAGHFVANDLELTGKGAQQLMILTGPNMSGKSTFMKQAAMICLLAQIGCYVPADQARIGIVDRIFTRIGASDDLSQGQSTFMVEMTETAYLLNNMTERSLILLDEIGRGTSTYDGVAIAWSVAEYLANNGARSIFATHYHELNGLADLFKQVVNYQVSVHEGNGELLFLHKVIPGGANRSYGIEVARMAGLPKQVLIRAQGIMAQMSSQEKQNRRRSPISDNTEQAKLELEL